MNPPQVKNELKRLEREPEEDLPLMTEASSRLNRIENDLQEGFKKALSSINNGNPWNNFLALKTFLSSNG